MSERLAFLVGNADTIEWRCWGDDDLNWREREILYRSHVDFRCPMIVLEIERQERLLATADEQIAAFTRRREKYLRAIPRLEKEHEMCEKRYWREEGA